MARVSRWLSSVRLSAVALYVALGAACLAPGHCAISFSPGHYEILTLHVVIFTSASFAPTELLIPSACARTFGPAKANAKAKDFPGFDCNLGDAFAGASFQFGAKVFNRDGAIVFPSVTCLWSGDVTKTGPEVYIFDKDPNDSASKAEMKCSGW